MKRIVFALAGALVTGSGGHLQSGQDRVPNTVLAVAPQSSSASEKRRPALSRNCTHPREGEYHTFGNRWGRYGDICIDRIEVSFEAFPDPSVGYSIASDRCPGLGNFGRFRRPDNLFEAPVSEQIVVWKRALADDLREFARQCGVRLDPTPFVDERFDRFYVDYGDGWWFERVGERFRQAPNITANRPVAGVR